MPKSKNGKPTKLETTSLIDSIVTDLTDNSLPWLMAIASDVQSVDVPTDRENTVFNRMIASWSNQDNNKALKQPTVYKPMAMLGFIQEVANQLPRRYISLIAQCNAQEDFDTSGGGGTGNDYYADFCEQLGVSTIARESIIPTIESDFDILNALHTGLRASAPQMDTDPLFMFKRDVIDPRGRVDDSTGKPRYVPRFRCTTIDDAVVAIMELDAERSVKRIAGLYDAVADVAA